MLTATRKRLKAVALREDLQPGITSPLKVDRAAGIIYRVKILGWDSANGRRYLPEAAQAAVSLYDGAKAFADHPAKPNETRASRDALGIWRNPVYQSDGLFADLHYFKTHSLAEQVAEDAERGLGVFGFSHNADGKGEVENGVFVVREIVEVRSVDLVTDPATVTNLWESRHMKKVTIRSVFESAAKGLDERKRKIVDALLEGDLVGPVTEMDEPGEGQSAEDALGDGFEQALIALFRAEGDPKEKAKKAGELIKSHHKLTNTDTEEGEGDDMTTKVGDDDKKEKEDKKEPEKDGDKKESRERKSDPALTALQEQVQKLQADKDLAELKEFIRAECDKKKLAPEAPLLEACVAIKDRAKITAHLEWLTKNAKPKASGPRSSSPGSYIPESRQGATPADAKEQAALLLR